MARLLLCMAVALAAFNVYAREAIIPGKDQLTSPNGDWGRGSGSPGGMVFQAAQGPDVIFSTATAPKVFIAGDGNGFNGDEFYLQVDLSAKPLTLAEGQSLVFCTRRAGKDLPHPTTMRVEGSNDLNNWQGDVIGYVYWIYRGEYTLEWSERIDLRMAPQSSYKYLRIYCEHNYQRELSPKGRRTMSMTFFQIYRLDKDEPYMPAGGNTAQFIDRFRLGTDYNLTMRDYSFVPTENILAPVNHSVPGLSDWAEWGKWSAGKWTGDDPEMLAKKYKFAMPSFASLTPDSSADIEAGVRQPAHVTEHVFYAIPGDAIPLYPYFDIASTPGYEENFYHWYDYRTGGDLDQLDFLINPSTAVPVNGHGYLTGRPVTSLRYDVYIKTVDDYLNFVKRVNAGETTLTAQLLNDLDFSGYEFTNPAQHMIGNTEGHAFKGIFDGNGFTISHFNLKLNQWTAGMFGYVAQGAWIGNFIMDETCEIEGVQIVGSVVADYINGDDSNPSLFTIERVFSKAKVTATIDGGTYGAGGLVGRLKNRGRFVMRQCGFGGTVHGKKAAAIVGWYDGGRAWGVTQFIEVFSNGTVENTDDTEYEKNRKWFIHSNDGSHWATNYNLWDCWDNNYEENASDYCVKQADGGYKDASGNYVWKSTLYMSNQLIKANLQEIIKEVLHYFKPSKDWRWDAALGMPISAVQYFTGDRSTGTSATFFTPRDPYKDKGEQEPLYNAGDKEYVIAADIAWTFNPSAHVDMASKTIQEPTIYGRHIFRIKDGKAFADEFSGSAEKNELYVRKNRRHVQARAGVDFQIRLDAPVPVESTTRSRFYYRVDDKEYRRVCSADVRVYKNNALIDNSYTADGKTKSLFRLDGEVAAYDERIIDGIAYHLHGSESNTYYRMLAADAAAATAGATYRVQLLAKDVDGQVIMVKSENGGADRELVLQEFEIRFVGERSGAMITEKKMHEHAETYEYLTDLFLENNFGDEDGQPRDKVNFDEYRFLESKANVANPDNYILTVDAAQNWRYYKWPMDWSESAYIFGYDKLHDYNSYQIVNNGSVTRYHGCQFPYVPQGYTSNFGKGKGLYDRLFYSTQGKEAGYYLTVNAASDPGVMARLQIRDLCLGSTIYVSAWVVEFSGEETANLAFNFVAVLDDEHGRQRIPLHSFVTGYVDNGGGNKEYYADGSVKPETAGDMGQWMRIFYKFVPSFTDKDFKLTDVDHFELELDNNCRSSHGADYGIDDIRLYVSAPDVTAQQKVLICDDTDLNDDGYETDIKVSTNYESLLQSLGVDEPKSLAENQQIDIYYTFIDKEKWLAAIEKYKDDKVDGFKKAFEEPGVQLVFDHNGDGNNTPFGRLTFNTFYTANGKFDYNESDDGKAYYETITQDGEDTRYIVFIAAPRSSLLRVHGEYVIALWCPSQNGENTQHTTTPGYEEFRPESDCSRICTFRIETSSAIKINGVVRDPQQEIVVCENESPVIQIDLATSDLDPVTKEPITIKNAYYDWYHGSYEEFDGVTTKRGTSLHECLVRFRANSHYHSAESMEGIEPEGEFTQDMIDLLTELSAPADPKVAPKLYLYQTSFVFPPVKVAQDADGNDIDTYCRVVAVPIDIYSGSYTICTQPTEVSLKVDNHAPTMYNGIYQGISYPARLVDIPLRAGLRQLQAVTCPASQADEPEAVLYVPIRRVLPVTDGVQAMYPDESNRNIVLVQTNDPNYKDLNYQTPNEMESLLAVGRLCSLTADVNGGADNRVGVVFYDDFHFREGYYYRLRFSYEEGEPVMEADDAADGGDEADGDDRKPCNGQLLFTIKVVPEYQRWTGAAGNLNWADDANWARVASADIYVDGARKAALSPYVTDGSVAAQANANAASYAPLDFTKVIIDDTPTAPHLFAPDTTPVSVNGRTYAWPSDPDDAEAGEATYDIQYDMAATLSGANIEARPWYTNRCAHIHFRPGAEIMNQHVLDVDSAWVDLKLAPGRWHTLSSPLQGVMAGDMYLPTDGAQQRTELFRPIEFSTDAYDRFAPAVFQRSWNKSGAATVYELNSASRDVAVATTWSNVYNDVLEPYGPGAGFSIKTDVSALASQPSEVIFRLPKDDSSYSYYEHEGDHTVSAPVSAPRANAYKLNAFDSKGRIEVTVNGRMDSRYFLVGNPFMAHLDMARFLEENEGVVLPKYWVMTANSQSSAIMDSHGYLIGTDDEPGYLAPMQGFFVEAKDGEVGSVTVRFTADMMHVDQNKAAAGTELKSPASRAGGAQAMRITALAGGEVSSVALVAIDDDASQAYRADEDAVLLTDERQRIAAQVYTVATGTATSINVLDRLQRTPLGVAADADTEVTLLFSDVDCLGGAMLYDAEADTYAPLYEGGEIKVTGASSGRYFLVSDRVDDALTSDIAIIVKGRACTVASTVGGELRANVCDMLGRVIAGHEGVDTLEFDLQPGMYVIEASDGRNVKTAKVIVR